MDEKIKDAEMTVSLALFNWFSTGKETVVTKEEVKQSWELIKKELEKLEVK